LGRKWYGEPTAVSNSIGYAIDRGRSHYVAIRVNADAGNVIDTHEHSGDFKEWYRLIATSHPPDHVRVLFFTDSLLFGGWQRLRFTVVTPAQLFGFVTFRPICKEIPDHNMRKCSAARPFALGDPLER
jgi:hypothetical protein